MHWPIAPFSIKSVRIQPPSSFTPQECPSINPLLFNDIWAKLQLGANRIGFEGCVKYHWGFYGITIKRIKLKIYCSLSLLRVRNSECGSRWTYWKLLNPLLGHWNHTKVQTGLRIFVTILSFAKEKGNLNNWSWLGSTSYQGLYHKCRQWNLC